MKRSLLMLTSAMLVPLAAHANSRPDNLEQTGAPYFMVDTDRGTSEALPLASTRSNVQVAGTVAHVRVSQVYRNRGSEPLEATYVFPGSTRAAVFAMRMKIGKRTINAKIQTKDEARKTYERAKAEGKSASLLEQHRPNVFQMSVANIMPGDRIEVQLDYVEMLVPDAGVYELVIPAVVGPRYAGDQGPGTTGTNEKWLNNPYVSKAPGQSPYKWGVDVKIDAGLPIAGLQSPSHRISPRFKGASTAGMRALDEDGGDRDFVLRYRLSGDRIQSGLLLLPGEDGEGGYFAAMMTPPRRPAPSMIPPREYVFVMDVSGSMNGFPLNTAKTLMRQLLSGLRPEDRFNVLLFAGGNRVLSAKSLPASPENLERAMAAIDRERGGGGTRLLPALKRTLALPRTEDMSTSIVVVTDGYVAVEREAFDLVRKGLNEANLFAFGIGRSVNRHLIEGLARAGMGEPFVVLDAGSAAKTADRFRRYIESPVLTNIGAHFDGFDAYDVEPATIPDLFAERPVLLFGKYRGQAKGRIVFEGRNAKGAFRRTMKVADATKDRSLIALRYLWARHRIRDLSDRLRFDRTDSTQKEITSLGLKHSLMTEFTSFVAVDNKVRNTSGSVRTVRQPVPLPKGMSVAGPPVPTRASKAYGTYGALGGRGGAAQSSVRRAKPRRRSRADRKPTGKRDRIMETVASEEVTSAGDRPTPARIVRFANIPQFQNDDLRAWIATRARLMGAERALRKCFGRHASKQSSLNGVLEVSLPSGAVKPTFRWTTPTGNAAFDQCAFKALASIRIPVFRSAYTLQMRIRLQR